MGLLGMIDDDTYRDKVVINGVWYDVPGDDMQFVVQLADGHTYWGDSQGKLTMLGVPLPTSGFAITHAQEDPISRAWATFTQLVRAMPSVGFDPGAWAVVADAFRESVSRHMAEPIVEAEVTEQEVWRWLMDHPSQAKQDVAMKLRAEFKIVRRVP